MAGNKPVAPQGRRRRFTLCVVAAAAVLVGVGVTVVLSRGGGDTGDCADALGDGRAPHTYG